MLIDVHTLSIPGLDSPPLSTGPYTNEDPQLAFDSLQGSSGNLEQGTNDDDDAAAQTNQNLMILGGFVSAMQAHVRFSPNCF